MSVGLEGESYGRPLGAGLLGGGGASRSKERSAGSSAPRLGGRLGYRIRRSLTIWALLLGGMALSIIWMRNYYYRLSVAEQSLERRVRDLRRESVVLSSRLMTQSRETQVSARVESRGLGLREPKDPPVVIRYVER